MTRIPTNDAPVPCAVYRYYDVDGQLLYVGSSISPNSRWTCTHNRSTWAALAANRVDQWFSSIPDARSEESRAIYEERPLYNKQGNPRAIVVDAVPSAPSDYQDGELVALIRVTCDRIDELNAQISDAIRSEPDCDKALKIARESYTAMCRLRDKACELRTEMAGQLWLAKGLSFADLGARVGVSKSRAEQLIKQYRTLEGS